MNEISARRVAGFVALAVAIVVGVLFVAYAASPPRFDPEATAIPTPVESVAAPKVSIEVPPPIR